MKNNTLKKKRTVLLTDAPVWTCVLQTSIPLLYRLRSDRHIPSYGNPLFCAFRCLERTNLATIMGKGTRTLRLPSYILSNSTINKIRNLSPDDLLD